MSSLVVKMDVVKVAMEPALLVLSGIEVGVAVVMLILGVDADILLHVSTCVATDASTVAFRGVLVDRVITTAGSIGVSGVAGVACIFSFLLVEAECVSEKAPSKNGAS